MKKILLVGNCPLPTENTKSRPAAGLRTYQFYKPLANRKDIDLKLVTVAMPECYGKDALDKIMEKNLLLWSIKYYDGRSIQYKEGLVKFNNSDSYLYFIKRVDEGTYKFFFVLPEKSNDSVLFYLNSLKQFKTI